jgi:hypothetical protein
MRDGKGRIAMARPGKGMRYFVPPAGPPLPQLSSSERQEIEGFALPQLSSPECAEIEKFAKLRLPHYAADSFWQT